MQYPIAVLMSGRGTTLANLIAWHAAGRLEADLRLVVSSSPDAGGLRSAAAYGIESLVLDHRTHRRADQLSPPLFAACRAREIRLVVCGGFLRKLEIPADFAGRVINIHPSLLPAFGGKGMYGLRVHEAVLASGATGSGCTVHLVDDEFDHGGIIAQRRVPVLPGDTANDLARRIFAEECELLPRVINAFAAGQIEAGAGRLVVPHELSGVAG
jgi:phosphoribosylglycinamide formyltransferase-1